MNGSIGAGWIAMVSLVLAVLRSLAAALQTRRDLVLENLALRHQLLVLNRRAKTPALRHADRLFWAALSMMWERWTKALVIVQPQTVVRWHQAGFRLYWRWKSRRRTGRTPTDRELIELIRRMWQSNPTWGSRRIQAELAKLGLQVSAATIRKYRPKGERGPPSQTWRAFLRNHTKQLVAVDYHHARTHRALAQDSPVPRPVLPPSHGTVVEFPQVGGLHHLYTRRAA